jgi:formylmethanofuran dehydrogenase subunit D
MIPLRTPLARRNPAASNRFRINPQPAAFLARGLENQSPGKAFPRFVWQPASAAATMDSLPRNPARPSLRRACVMSETFVLIPGRTSKQGCGISEGKLTSQDYRSETTTLQVSPADMQRLGLADGDRVRLASDTGAIEVAVAAAKGDELPPGILFIAYGDLSSRLMGGDTHGSGMPTSKGLDVTLEKI